MELLEKASTWSLLMSRTLILIITKNASANCRHCKIRQGICGNEEPDHKDVEVLFRQHVR